MAVRDVVQAAAGALGAATYIEDVFSTYLYTGNGSTQTITNGIDLDGEGGLVWLKRRNDTYGHYLFDTDRGVSQSLTTNTNDAQANQSPDGVNAFNSNGFTISSSQQAWNNSAGTYASWTFRKAPKFFDVVTYTGNGVSGRTVAHNLGSVPGCIIVKCLNDNTDWPVYHRRLNGGVNPQEYRLRLNSTVSEYGPGAEWSAGAPTATEFTLTNAGDVNASGRPYVAYLFAHDAGGFGDDGSENVISCGSFTTDGSGNATVTLGWEPQFVLMKYSSQSSDWMILDNMRGFRVTGNSSPGNNGLFPNLSNAESASNATISTYVDPTATGFVPFGFGPSKTIIYIAIRRGPMKTPTTGTSVYTGITRTGTGANATVTGTGFPVDLLLSGSRNAAFGTIDFDRLRGATQRLFTYSTAAEAARSTSLTSFAVQDGYTIGDDATDGGLNNSGQTYIYWNFRRAPGFFDVVCYTGTGSSPNTQNHNLGVAPELMIVKSRTTAYNWAVWHSFTGSDFKLQYLNTTGAAGTISYSSSYMPSAPTATQFAFGTTTLANDSGGTYVAYLFATVAGVSKVGSYTGTGSTLQVNCGFTAGARFVLIKRFDSTGDWYVWDSARGIVAGNDPYLLLNSTAAEVTSTDYVDTYSAGFEISSTAPAAINASGGTFIFLAIA